LNVALRLVSLVLLIVAWSVGRGLIASRLDVTECATSQSGTGYWHWRLWVMSG
jgi:hypothetical protein